VILLRHKSTGYPKFNQKFKLAGFEQVSVGFMQTVFELLTKPGDIVLDWAVGGGASFTAGYFLNRFVIGADGRSKFSNFAKSSLQTVLEKMPPRTSAPAKKTGKGHDTLCSNQEEEDEKREGIAICAQRRLRAMPTSNYKLKNSDK
jgi:hypothetical protein